MLMCVMVYAYALQAACSSSSNGSSSDSSNTSVTVLVQLITVQPQRGKASTTGTCSADYTRKYTCNITAQYYIQVAATHMQR
jgi:hypothetical protein